MTYSDWREELSEAKARIVIKGLKTLGNVIRKVRKTKKPSIFIKSADGTKIQNPNVKPFTPEPSGQLPLINLKNPNLKGTNPVAKTTKPLKDSRAIYKQNKRKELEELERTAKGIRNQQNKLKQQALDGLQVNLLKKSDYKSKKLRDLLGNDFERISKMQESVAALAKKGGSKVIPALMTSIGAAGTIMQSKKDKKEPSDAAAKRLENIRNNKLYRKSKNPKDPSYLEKLLRNLRKEEVAIANSMSGGGIAGSVEAGDEPPVNKEKKKKKKTYAYGGRGSRKMWMK